MQRRRGAGGSTSGGGSKLESIKVAFLHPDLGIGGAERLVVDAGERVRTAVAWVDVWRGKVAMLCMSSLCFTKALALKDSGYDVDLYTCHHDPTRCFKETADGSLNVKVYGNW